MNSEWPIRAEAPRAPASPPGRPGDAAPVFRRPDGAARRLRDATLDLFLPNGNRVNDRIRASVSVMLDGVVGGIERQMRRTLLTHFTDRAELYASLASPSVGIVRPLLSDAGTLAHPPLVAILLRRAEAFILGRRTATDDAGDGLPIDDADPLVTAAATALLVADARRIDGFGEPAVLPDDLPAELFAWLVWRVAAALRRYLCDQHAVEQPFADDLITDAATMVLTGHDEGRGVDALAAALAARLFEADRLDGRAFVAMLADGQIAAFAAGLAAAAGLPMAETWPIVADPVDGRLALLLRAAGVDRTSAAVLLLQLVPPGADAAAEIDVFDDCDLLRAAQALAALRLPGDYRTAIDDLDTALGAAT